MSFGQKKIDHKNLDRLMQKAQASHSSAIIIYQDNKLVKEWYVDDTSRQTELMSATKSIVSLSFGLLLKQGKIDSLDQPVYSFYPEWKQGKKEGITIRHLLNHTSGIQSLSNTRDIYPSPDFVQLALSAELNTEPGSTFFYNNKATNLLAGIVEKASGLRMDKYLDLYLFKPLGIKEFEWVLDDKGNPHGMSGLQLHPKDLAKIGLLLLNNGKWEKQQLIDKAWIEQSIIPSQSFNPQCGLLWWIVYDKVNYVVDAAQLELVKEYCSSPIFFEKLQLVIGTYSSREAYFAKLESVFGAKWKNEFYQYLQTPGIPISKKKYSTPIGYAAKGYMGQYMYIYPQKKIVAIRMNDDYEKYEQGLDDYESFGSDIYIFSK